MNSRFGADQTTEVDRQYSFVETGSSHPLPPSTDDWYENGERAHKINGRTTALADNLPTNWARERPLGKHPAISSGFLFLGVRAYVSTIRKRTRAHYFPRHFDGAHTADL